MAKRSRVKGAAAELDLVSLCKDAGFLGAHRTAAQQAGERREDEARKKYPDVDGVPLLWLENKHEKRCSPKAYARKYLGAERPGFVPVVCWRENGMGPSQAVAELRATDLLKLVRELCDLRHEVVSLRHRLNIVDPPFGVGGL